MQTTSGMFASDGAGRVQRALLIRPTAALDGVVPLGGEPSPIFARALEQHDVFARTLGYHGVDAVVLDAESAGPFAALAADLAVMLPQGALLMRPTDLGRRANVAQVERVLSGHLHRAIQTRFAGTLASTIAKVVLWPSPIASPPIA